MSLHGWLHAATRAGASDASGREALLRYVLRPPIAQDKIEQGQDGLVRIVLKKPFPDGTIAVEMDPLSLPCRLAASVPPPRLVARRTGALLSRPEQHRSDDVVVLNWHQEPKRLAPPD